MAKNKAIRIPLSDEDLQDLQGGGSFDWTFDGVDVHLFLTYGVCESCDEDLEQEPEEDGLCINCSKTN